jgi:hypothetical protein
VQELRFWFVSEWHPSIANGRHAQVSPVRRCSRNGCSQPAVATLTYVYADSTAVIGPLAASAEPHSYDLCDTHARTLTAPRGWEVVRPEGEFDPPPPVPDDLVALADAVREPRGAVRRRDPSHTPPRARRPASERSHLRVLPPPATG